MTKRLRVTKKCLDDQQASNKIIQEHWEVSDFSNALAGCNENNTVKYVNILKRHTLRRIRVSEVNRDQEALEIS